MPEVEDVTGTVALNSQSLSQIALSLPIQLGSRIQLQFRDVMSPGIDHPQICPANRHFPRFIANRGSRQRLLASD